MGWESEQENRAEPADRAKWIWAGIVVAMVVMLVVIFLMDTDQGQGSRARVKHILIAPIRQIDSLDQFDEARQATLDHANDIKRQLDEGADFGKMAKEYSGDPGTKNTGGHLGWVGHGEMADAFDAYVWSGKVGVVSEPIGTNYGFHLIYIIERIISDKEIYDIDLNRRVNEMNQAKP